MTDAGWAGVRDLLPVPGWLEGRGRGAGGYCHRKMVDAVRYLVDNGIKWRAMPTDSPAWDRVYAFWRRWRNKGLISELHRACCSRATAWGGGSDGRSIPAAGPAVARAAGASCPPRGLQGPLPGAHPVPRDIRQGRGERHASVWVCQKFGVTGVVEVMGGRRRVGRRR
ncbi:transposase [Streptomyces meridianus]|uniref:Transposase n=1 Tax=Streptomyces meridianus TaxID=2938945 RepID=A0ABT0XCB0_9ACTN|nr:transposase [Streptomyces meridianus]MCM2580151.1 transposase [Streptomyces meridianus]